MKYIKKADFNAYEKQKEKEKHDLVPRNMPFKERLKFATPRQWRNFAIVMVCYLVFLIWVQSWLGLIVVPFIFDFYISKYIRWHWWKYTEGLTHAIMSWVDALVFALVAVYFLNLFFFQNFVIPSSSLEKSLLTGDYLCVSKLSYGPRIPQTPLSMPLVQNTLPLFNCNSYFYYPHWKYRRVKGLGKVKLNDIVVFNYPAGDTVCTEQPYVTEYYAMCYQLGQQIYDQNYQSVSVPSLSLQQQHDYFDFIYSLGRRYILDNPTTYGSIITRPVDREENYVKRCVGLPGQTLQIKNRIVYLDGKPNKEPDNVQYSYYVSLKQDLPDDLLHQLGISMEDVQGLNRDGCMPLTYQSVKALKARKDLVKSIRLNTDATTGDLYPLNMVTGWTRDNYGPIWIPKKGATLKLSMRNIAIYERPIRVYENNDLQIKNGRIYINGKERHYYTFKMDYYWMMGDNRHNSEDSRYWGFVPEDHIVGKPLFIWFSSDPDRHGFSGVRWNRIFKWVDNIK